MTEYNIQMRDKFGHSARIDVGAEAAAVTDAWFNQTLTTVNDSLVRMGVFLGEFHWHQHEADDEFFFVLEGQLLLDVEGGETVVLEPHQGYTVPKGVMHRPRAPQRTVVLMVESTGIVPTGSDPGRSVASGDAL